MPLGVHPLGWPRSRDDFTPFSAMLFQQYSQPSWHSPTPPPLHAHSLLCPGLNPASVAHAYSLQMPSTARLINGSSLFTTWIKCPLRSYVFSVLLTQRGIWIPVPHLTWCRILHPLLHRHLAHPLRLRLPLLTLTWPLFFVLVLLPSTSWWRAPKLVFISPRSPSLFLSLTPTSPLSRTLQTGPHWSSLVASHARRICCVH